MYDLMQIKSVIREAIENRGIDYVEDDTPLDLDSLQFISLIVDIESALNITIEDEYLVPERFLSYASIERTVSDILGKYECIG
jgi:acyl carrier protein